jgi:hypothetical protein
MFIRIVEVEERPVDIGTRSSCGSLGNGLLGS